VRASDVEYREELLWWIVCFTPIFIPSGETTSKPFTTGFFGIVPPIARHKCRACPARTSYTYPAITVPEQSRI